MTADDIFEEAPTDLWTRPEPPDRAPLPPPPPRRARRGPHVVRIRAGARPGQLDRDEHLWDVLRTAEFLSMSKHWVYRAVAAGIIPYRKIGAAIRFVPAEIKAWADARRAGGDAASSDG